jgi:quinoprotein glucose dehydrogenase
MSRLPASSPPRRAPLARASSLAVLLAIALGPTVLHGQLPPAPAEWTAWGRDAGGTRYSPLTDLHAGNVADLEVAWIYRTGDLLPERGRFQSTPLMVGGRLYVTSPLGRVSAVDPTDGRELWTFDPGVDLSGSYGDFANRGAAYWRASEADVAGPGASRRGMRLRLRRAATPGPACAARIFVATIDARLIALDAVEGARCPGFGQTGEVDLKTGLRNPPTHLGEYQVTSPPAVIGDRVVVGSAIADNQRVDAPSGMVRAFDAVTGRLIWSWDPVPQDPADPAHATWTGPDVHRTGAANAWAPISADPELGLVFVPTSSPSPDFYGGERLGRNDYANSLVALDAETGRVRWHFQVVHHDLWDYDIPAQPVLFPFPGASAPIPAVAVATKMGHLFLFDRRTGEPLHPIEERPVPASTVPGEEAWPTQPFPVRPAPLVPQHIDPDGPLGASEEDARWCRARLRDLRNDGPFTPPSLEGTVVFPGNIGGMQWGGVAVDPVRGIAVAPTNRLPFVITLVPRGEIAARRAEATGAEISPQRGTPYGMMREVFLAPSGAPCAPPPWSALAAVDLASGEPLWEVPLGSLGLPAMGGAVVTAGGLAFMAGTPDGTLRAFDVETGGVLWEGALPTDALSTPMTYRAEGRQYVVVAAGGHDRLRALSGAPLGDHLVAFALPESGSPPTPGARASVAAAGEAPAAEPVPAGSWTGEVRAGPNRFAASLEIAAAAEGPLARLAIPEVDLRAELRGRAADPGGWTFTGTFRADGESCTGSVRLDAEVANHGTLLVGLFRVEGPCIDSGVATGAFSFRRPAEAISR